MFLYMFKVFVQTAVPAAICTVSPGEAAATAVCTVFKEQSSALMTAACVWLKTPNKRKVTNTERKQVTIFTTSRLLINDGVIVCNVLMNNKKFSCSGI